MFISYQRNNLERNNNTVELAVNYEDLLDLAEREGVAPSVVLKEAKKAGITSLAVYETTFKKLNANGKASAVAGSQIIKDYHDGSLFAPAWREAVQQNVIVPTDVYITGHDAQTFAELREDVVLRLGKKRVKFLQIGDEPVIAVKMPYDDFVKMNMGMPTDEMRTVNAAGFYVLARPSNYTDVNKTDINAVFNRLQGIKVSDIVFSGPEILGAPDLLWYTAEKMEKQHITLGMIENITQLKFYPQKGLIGLADDLHYKAARLYTIPKGEQPKLKMSVAVERWSNTDEERNIRIDLLRPYLRPAPNMTLLETNMKYFSETKHKLESKGFKIGPASAFPQYTPAPIWRILVLWGACAAAVYYLSLVIPRLATKYQYGLWFISALICTVPITMGSGGKIRILGALVSANVFPAIAMITLLDWLLRQKRDENTGWWRVAITATIALVITSAISLAGSFFVSGILSDTRYFLEIDIFRGIKLTFIMPIILVGIALLQRVNLFSTDEALLSPGIGPQLKRIMNIQVYIKTLLAFVFFLVALIIFIGRSGHTEGIPVPGIELKVRAILEQTFYARPRSKEIFIGHPAFFIMMMAWLRRWRSGLFGTFVLIATIGQGSMVETFAHMRTPFYMSMVRGTDGVMLGVVFGLIAIFLLQMWYYFIKRSERGNKTRHE